MSRMKVILASAIALSLQGAPSFAMSYGEQIDMCSDAIVKQEIADLENYDVKFVRATGASTKRITLKLVAQSGDDLIAECKIRRGVVQDIALKN